ncbi:unnamed protein product [Durusdinium trenchii]|uniref:Uncharacterized protein n=1 Tax=Durusdinium trenchii TaxID=1381693 RepID=A0ABP0QX12_9DINO
MALPTEDRYGILWTRPLIQAEQIAKFVIKSGGRRDLIAELGLGLQEVCRTSSTSSTYRSIAVDRWNAIPPLAHSLAVSPSSKEQQQAKSACEQKQLRSFGRQGAGPLSFGRFSVKERQAIFSSSHHCWWKSRRRASWVSDDPTTFYKI